jgi:hypothetical protein
MDLIHLLPMFQSQNMRPMLDRAEGRTRTREAGAKNRRTDFAMMNGINMNGPCEWRGAVEGKMSRKVKVFKEELVTEIGEDRRGRRRYDIDLNLEYKVVRHYQVCQKGTGKTVNFSGGGVAFETSDSLRPGSTVELAIAWPIMLNSTCPLKLVVTGKVVRSSAALTAVRMERYEFRTQGVRALSMAAFSA